MKHILTILTSYRSYPINSINSNNSTNSSNLPLFAIFLCLSLFTISNLHAQNNYPNYDEHHNHPDHDHYHEHEPVEEKYYNKNKRVRQQRKNSKNKKHRHQHNEYDNHPYDDNDYGSNDGYHDYDYNGRMMFDQAVYWHLVPLGQNTFQVSYEMRKMAIDGGIRAWLFSGGITLSNKRKKEQKGFLGELQYRYYFNQLGPNFELYGAPYVQFRQISIERGSYNDQNEYVQSFDDLSSFSGGVLFGLHFLLFDQLILELQGGGGFMNSNVPEDADRYYGDNPWEIGYTGIAVKGSINVGFAF